jgi:predicted AAA+ superfamily ATPase
MPYYHRVIERTVREYLKLFPVVGLTGPRQSGKSTLLQRLLGAKYRYISFDDPNTVDRFDADPERFMGAYSDRVIFDEVQRVPDLFHYVKVIVDNNRSDYGKFIMTGSSQFAFMKRISESLAGRIGLLTLLPFQFSEIPAGLREESLYLGGYPELVARKYRGAYDWYSSYVDTYLTRDVRDISDIGDIRDFRRFIQMLAARVAQILNMSEIARDLGVSVPTIKKWTSVLEASYIIFLLPPFHKNLGKRIVKSPKIYFYDTGLVSYLTGIRTRQLFEDGPMYGALFENYVVSEVYKRLIHTRTDAELFFFRESNGNEIDLIIDRKSTREHIEIKSGHTFRPEMARLLMQLADGAEHSWVVYRGKEIALGDGISAVNFKSFLNATMVKNRRRATDRTRAIRSS